MPSPGSLHYLGRQRLDGRPHTLEECDRALERLSDLARQGRPVIRQQALDRADSWLDERLRAKKAA